MSAAASSGARAVPRPRGLRQLTGYTCRNGHPYVEGSYSWQRSGNGYLYVQCNRCNAERRATGKPRGRPRKSAPTSL
jgi:hypothetical protein